MSGPAGMPRAVAERAVETLTVHGAEVPAHFGDAAAEYRAAHEAVGLSHRVGRALFRVEGEDRGKFLQGLLSNDVAALQPGGGCRALFLDNKGHVRGVLDLWAGGEAIVVACESRFIDEALADLTRYILAADVRIEDLREHESVLGLVGPEADETLRSAGLEVPPQTPYSHSPGEIAGTRVWVARTPDLGVPGAELHVPNASVDAVWSALAAIGDPPPRWLGWQAAEVLRIEAGLVRRGHEINGEEFPQELLLDGAVDYEKGCYLGQETVARIHYRGQVNRLLSGLRADAPLPEGAELISSERQVGRVTSAAASPAHGPVGLALVRREESQGGVTVQVRADDTVVTEARVLSLPIHG